MNKIIKFDNKEININFDDYALLSKSSLMINLEDTKILITLNTRSNKNDIPSFLPLQIIFQERMYAVNKIPGGFNKREGKPSNFATLIARLVDRSIRPLFPKTLSTEIQIVITAISITNEEHIPFLSLLGTSLVIQKANLPFEGPVSGIGAIVDTNNNVHISPNEITSLEYNSKYFFAGPTNIVNMIEFDGYEVEDKEFNKISEDIFKKIQKLNVLQENLMKNIKKEKEPVLVYNERNDETKKYVSQFKVDIEDILKEKGYLDRREKSDEVVKKIISLNKNDELKDSQIMDEFYYLYGDIVKKNILSKGIRPDGRKESDIRKISSNVSVNNTGHGSAIFRRGFTQVASFLTLGAAKENQIIDNLTIEHEKLFLHHYNFPPFSVGETGRMGIPSRREIGHGSLAEKSLAKILPKKEDFPYTIRIVSEVLTSNGSTSQGAICAGVMSLMDGGVPIKNPISGIAMGLINDKKIILTDIEGLEDHVGDMDFKISGSKKGFTAIQMDLKIKGISFELMKQIVSKGKIGYLKILDNMLKTIDKSNNDLKPSAVKYESLTIPIESIGKVIGPQGKNIKELIARHDDAQIDIEDSGIIFVYHKDRKQILSIINEIKLITKEWKIGEEVNNAEVFRVEPFGAFVKAGDKDVLIHVSKLSKDFVKNANDIVKVGDKLDIIISETKQGKIQGKIKIKK